MSSTTYTLAEVLATPFEEWEQPTWFPLTVFTEEEQKEWWDTATDAIGIMKYPKNKKCCLAHPEVECYSVVQHHTHTKKGHTTLYLRQDEKRDVCDWVCDSCWDNYKKDHPLKSKSVGLKRVATPMKPILSSYSNFQPDAVQSELLENNDFYLHDEPNLYIGGKCFEVASGKSAVVVFHDTLKSAMDTIREADQTSTLAIQACRKTGLKKKKGDPILPQDWKFQIMIKNHKVKRQPPSRQNAMTRVILPVGWDGEVVAVGQESWRKHNYTDSGDRIRVEDQVIVSGDED